MGNKNKDLKRKSDKGLISFCYCYFYMSDVDMLHYMTSEINLKKIEWKVFS